MEKITAPVTQIDSWNKYGYTVEATGANVSLILVGEWHYVRSFQKAQNRLIYELGPEYVLHENLRNRRYDPETTKFPILRPHEVSDDYDTGEHVSQVLLELCRLKRFELLGMDLSNGELRDKIRGLKRSNNPRNVKVHENGLIGTYQDSQGLKFGGFIRGFPESFPFREEQMVKMMKEYTALSTRPVIAVAGSDHVKTIHSEGLLKNAGFDYCVIDQGSTFNGEEASYANFRPSRRLTMRGVHYTIDK
jgi:hypothetical protein